MQILAATYGLTVAPWKCYLHFSTTVQVLGAQEMEAEPCVYVLRDQFRATRAVGAQYVDDVMVAGVPGNAVFDDFFPEAEDSLPMGRSEPRCERY